jgi:flavin reductase (DIM6/NTAB) family NADH-FMN oxidoreductase RutF
MLDAATFRAVLGRLASGVSIITTRDMYGIDHGMTVTALCSLSLDPPLILVCVDRIATMYPHLMTADHLAVSMLAKEQEALSHRFAVIKEDRFGGVPIVRATNGCALIDEALAHMECDMWARHDGGDHTIFIGRVTRAAAREAQPLLYYRGRYANLEGT